MIRLRCSSCGHEVEVESLLTAANQPCPACGRSVIGGGEDPAPRTPPPTERSPAAEDTPGETPAEDAPAEEGAPATGEPQPERWRDQPPRLHDKAPEPSATVTLLAYLLVVTGVPSLLSVFCCGPFWLFPSEQGGIGAMLANLPLLLFFGVLFAAQCVAGAGVLRRRQWARFLACGATGLLLLGSVAVSFNGGSIYLVFLLLPVCVVTCAVLLNAEASAEFDREDAWQFP